MPDPRLAPAEPTEADHQHVKELVSRAGLPPSEEELARLTRSYLMLKVGVESLYQVAEARYEVPALIFDPAPTFEDWSNTP